MSDDADKPLRDYRETVFLPDTPFPMRAGLPQAEPKHAGAAGRPLSGDPRQPARRAGAPLFVLHDGPPYANGAIHIGHALNKILKDFVVRSRFALGYDVDYVPGWDCHGLPIEWKIEEEFRGQGPAQGRGLEGRVPRPLPRLRRAAGSPSRAREFKRLGVLGDWDHRYSTMDFASEAAIVAEFHKFIATDQLYRGAKPVMWSPVERTALADAEVEYHDHVSPTIWVKFPVTDGPQAPTIGGSVVIWTTTPWTIPGNRAIAYNPDIAYAVYRVEALEEDLPFAPWAKVGERADPGREAGRTRCCAAAKIAKWLKLERGRPAGHGLRPPAGRARRRATAFACRCWPATTSPTTPAPASCTPRPATAPRTIRSGWRTGIARSPRRSTRTAPTWPTCRCSPG